MTDMNSRQCPRCGTPKLAALDGNCPNCLIDLGAPDWPAEPAFPGPSGPLPRMGEYELLEEVARGGMGVVYRARQLGLNRTVAVKVLLAGQFADATFLQRFRREAEAAASLSHPNIVAIHEVGEHEGRPYFSMELIEGRSLAELVHENPLPAREAAQLVKTIAEAVHFAHERGVLHRDLKPANVLVDAQGAPHVTDFGLAKFVAQASPPASSGGVPVARPDSGRGRPEDPQAGTPALQDLTLSGQVLGSPNYMPPEQADPKCGPTTAASDVYSLGAILYQLLTGRAPFMAETMTQTLRLVAEGEPVVPRLLNPALSRDLETICLKCLEKEAPRRYASARELAEELGRFLRDEPICARPIGPLGRLARWRRRKPALAASLGAGALLLLVVLVGLPVALVRINNARTHAEEARGRAESAERAAEARLYAALLEQARATVRSGEMGQRVRTLDAVRRAAGISNAAELRREALAALALPDLRFERELPTGIDCTMAVLDPAFERLAVGRGSNAVEIQSVPDQRQLALLPIDAPDQAVTGRWSADGRFLAVRLKRHGAALHRIEVWDVAAARRMLQLPATIWGACAFHPRAPRVLADEGDGLLRLWDLENGQPAATFAATGLVHHVEFSPDGWSFLVQHRVGALWFISLHDAESGAVRQMRPTGWTDGIAWERNDRWLAFAARNGEVHLHDRRTSETTLLGRHKREARTATFTADGDFLFTGGEEQESICWDLRRQERAFTIGPRSSRVQTAGHGARCAVVTATSLQLYSLESSRTSRDLPEDPGSGYRHAAFSPDGRWLAAGGLTRPAVWDLTTDSPPALPFNAEQVKMVFSPDSAELYAFNEVTSARWRIAAGPGTRAPPRLTPLRFPTTNRMFSLNFAGNELVLGDLEGALIVSDFGRGTNASYAGTLGYTIAEVSPNGVWLAARKSRVVVPCRLQPWAVLGHVEAGLDLFAHAFTPASDELVLATRVGLTFFDTNRWEPRRRLAVPLDRNARIIFTPDGREFWLARDARNAALHDLRTFEELLPLPSHVTPLALSADGRYLAVEVDARRMQVWDLVEIRGRLRELGLE
jgi:serine/threonine protein kinase/WD40 repeat protein